MAPNIARVRAVRGTKEPEGAFLIFGCERFGSFIESLKSGDFEKISNLLLQPYPRHSHVGLIRLGMTEAPVIRAA